MELKTGSAESTLDDKGRVSIPVRFRGQFQGTLIITRSLDPCVWIMMPDTWERVKKNLSDPTVFTPEALRYYKETLIDLHDEVRLDKVGRIAIPSTFRSYANLTKDCMVISAGDRLSLWDSREFNAHTKSGPKTNDESLNKLGEGGIFGAR